MEVYVLAMASGILAAVAVALWLRVRRLDKQNDVILELVEGVLSKGMTVDVRMKIPRSQRQQPAASAKKGDLSKKTMLKSVATRSLDLPALMKEQPDYEILLKSVELHQAEGVFIIYVKKKSGTNCVIKRRSKQIEAFVKTLQGAYKKQYKKSLPKLSLPSTWSEGVLKEAGDSFTNFFKRLPSEAQSLPCFITFFRPVAKRTSIGPKAPLPSLPPQPKDKKKSPSSSLSGSSSSPSLSTLTSSCPPSTSPRNISSSSSSSSSSLSHAPSVPNLPVVPSGLNCLNLKNDSAVEYVEGYNYLDSQKKVMSLSRGKTFFTFACHSGSHLTDKELLHVDSIVNLSGFKDELAENGVESVNIRNPQEAALYTVAIVKNAYMLPHTKLEDFTPELLCSSEYLHGCMPGPPKIWKEVPDKTTFRITKTIVPWVFNMTIQFKVHELDAKHLVSLSQLDNCPVHKAVILERTKRDKSAQDATKKAKSVLLYTVVDGGVLCRNITVCLNSFIPNFVVPFIDTLGSLGSKETKDTAVMTRNFFKKYAKKKGRL